MGECAKQTYFYTKHHGGVRQGHLTGHTVQQPNSSVRPKNATGRSVLLHTGNT